MKIVLLLFGILAAVNGDLIQVTPDVFVDLNQDQSTYRVSLNGQKEWTAPIAMKTELQLKPGVIDPATYNFPRMSMYGDEEVLAIVQFWTKPLEAYQNEIKKVGGKVLFYLPFQSLLVKITPSQLAKFKSQPYVRVVAPYVAEFKIDPQLFKSPMTKNVAYSIIVNERGSHIQARLSEYIETLGGKVTLTTSGMRMEAILSPSQLTYVLNHVDVLYIDLVTELGEDMNIVRIHGGADYVESVAGYTGKGVRAEVCDSGLYTSHSDFQSLNVEIHGSNSGSTSHGTSVFGIVFGDGTGNAQGRGMMPDADLSIFAAYGSLGDRMNHTMELVDPDMPYRAIFQTNSWGNTQTSQYTSISAEMDDIIFNTDLLILQSQSNTGNTRSRPQAWAKNILSVGAFYHDDTLFQGDDGWRNGASIGPAEDGRQKPDLAHFYDRVYTTSSSGSYTQFSGTSAATPITAGHVGIFYQMWADGVFDGRNGQERDVFDVRAHSSTAKAVLINSASQKQFDDQGTQVGFRRYIQGWGTADLTYMYDVAYINNWRYPVLVDESDPIGQFETHEYNVVVSASKPSQIRMTLVYRDPMPAVITSRQLVNNLELSATSPSGLVYYGNHGLDEGECSTPGGSPAGIDNVENIIICKNDWESGTWTVSVYGEDIVVDTNPESRDIDAVYSLVVTKV